MPITRNNERSEAIKLISYINAFLADKTWRIQSAGGETTIYDGKKHMFPDVILYGDSFQTQILQGWELKMPDVPINDEEFVKDAQRKAITLGLNSCFIWNFTCGVLYKRNADNSFSEIKRWNDTSFIRSRQDVDTFRSEWMRIIGSILEEINKYFVSGHFLPAELGNVISDTVLSEIIRRNKHFLADTLKKQGQKDVRIHARIQKWWEQVQTEYASDEVDAYVAYARVIIVNWSNRLLFAHVLKRFHDPAKEIEKLTYDSTPAHANELFCSISQTCDFHNVFVTMDDNEIIPDCMWHDLMELNEFLSSNAICYVNQTALQTVLEHTVSSGKRELIGQFTTPQILALILSKISMRDITAACIDPCCGTGSIAQAVLGNKLDHRIPLAAAYATTWASDKYSFPLQIASISMARVDSINQPIRIFQSNAFTLKPDQQINLVDPANGSSITCNLPLFGTIVSNLPFVPFEKIERDELKYIREIHTSVYRKTGIDLDDRTDLYQNLLFSFYPLLNRNGRLGVITSNSWLGTKAGRQFFDALCWYYDIDQVHISGKGRWFHNAQIVTTMLVLSKKEEICAPKEDCIIRFYVWKKALQDFDSTDINAIISDAILDECNHPDRLTLSAYKKSDIDMLLGMNVSINALFYKVNWLKDLKDIVCPITDYLEVTRGERRGWDTMFYPTGNHGIEAKYLKKVLKSSRQLDYLYATPDSDAFCCGDSILEMEQAGYTGALRWIRSFENAVNKKGKPLEKVLSRSNMYWYEMRDTSTADFVTGMNPDKRLFVAKFSEPTFVNQRLIAFKQINRSVDADVLHALLNSIIGMFYIEAIGFGRGLGALDINATNIRSMRMLNPVFLTEQNKKDILTAFLPLKMRKVLGTTEELEQPDRIHFDQTVLTAFGIRQYYDDIRDALLSMQYVRHAVKQ